METNYLLIVTAVLFLILIVRGYKRGFLRIAVYFAGLIFIIVAAKRVSPYVSSYLIKNTNAYTTIQTNITEKFKEKNLARDNTQMENQILTIRSYELPDVLKDSLIENNTKEMYSNLLVNLFEEYVSAYLAKTAVNAMSFLAMVVIFWIAFQIVLWFADIIGRIPVIKGINKLAGAMVGFIESVIITWIFFFVVIVFIGNDFGTKMLYMVERSAFLRLLFNSNILLAILK